MNPTIRAAVESAATDLTDALAEGTKDDRAAQLVARAADLLAACKRRFDQDAATATIDDSIATAITAAAVARSSSPAPAQPSSDSSDAGATSSLQVEPAASADPSATGSDPAATGGTP